MVFDDPERVAGRHAAVLFGDVHAMVADVDVELARTGLMQAFALEDAYRDRAVLVLVDDELSDVRIGRRVDRQDVAGSDADMEVIGCGERPKVPPRQPMV